MLNPIPFQRLILKWHDQFGRKNLPWQIDKSPYRVWISEVMLQQTQVATVIPYFQRFMDHFPTLEHLARAPLDQVMHIWAGLGYYSRARNIHQAAKLMVENFSGKFPDTLDAMMTLPGIGRSTAGAILSIAFNQPGVILDGNVKRVLTRFACVVSPIDAKMEKHLWSLAENYAPQKRTAEYTQAMMDLGATVCIRGKPLCERCPLAKHCVAKREGIAAELPLRKQKKQIPTREATFIFIRHEGRILLQKRTSSGIWGGLWCAPQLSGPPEIKAIRQYISQVLHLSVSKTLQVMPTYKHSFSHYHLLMHPVVVELCSSKAKMMDAEQQIWYNIEQPDGVGLPKPIHKLVARLYE